MVQERARRLFKTDGIVTTIVHNLQLVLWRFEDLKTNSSCDFFFTCKRWPQLKPRRLRRAVSTTSWQKITKISRRGPTAKLPRATSFFQSKCHLPSIIRLQGRPELLQKARLLLKLTFTRLYRFLQEQMPPPIHNSSARSSRTAPKTAIAFKIDFARRYRLASSVSDFGTRD